VADEFLSQSTNWRSNSVAAHLDGNPVPHAILWRVSAGANFKPIIAIVGPTASGKSTLGIEVALALNGEIINCDSVQVYQGIEIATAKVPYAERRGVPHHLIDFVPPEINYTAGEWAREAIAQIEEIERRGKVPILVGGTGLYLRALRTPFFKSPQTDSELRRRINVIRETRGPAYLHRVLQRLDHEMATQLYPRDWPRVQRALEVRLQTGQPMSAQKGQRPEPHESAQRLRIVVLNPPRNELYQFINQRTEQHFAAGLVAEVKALLAQGVPKDSNALGAHGYRRVVEYLEGKRDLSSAIEQTKQDVRNYAKRQLTWFRREPASVWFEGFGQEENAKRAVFRTLPKPPEVKT
jgi:tRNA dimethylallyltransferase